MTIDKFHNLWVLGQRVKVVTVTQAYSLIDIIAPASVPGPPPHVHQDCSELFYVLEGAVEVLVHEKRLLLNVGQSAVVPRRTLHTFHNPTNADVRIISIFSPAGFEKFFLDMGVSADVPNARAASVDGKIIGRVVAEAARYRMEIPPPQDQ
ncbi:MAG: cupin domain-containing protein [Desulfobacterales bacterium]